MSFLDSDWRNIAKKAYSVWFALAALLLLHGSDLIYLGFGVDTNPSAWTWILHWFLIAIIVSRFIPQPKKNAWKRRAVVIIFILLVCGLNGKSMADERYLPPISNFDYEIELTTDLVISFEGEHKIGPFHVGYLDIVDVPTICYGHTETAVVGHRKTDAQCVQLLANDLQTYRNGLREYFSTKTKYYYLTPHRGAAFTSLAYNVGIRGAGRSTATRRLNQGNIKGACNALTWWNRAGGRVVRGLVRRRSEEQRYCLIGEA